MDFADLRTKHAELIDFLGCCPLSTNDIIDAMEAGDCFCIGLKVERPESAIADPSKLRILDIVPTFMQSESFLDSATFKLGKNSENAGGFSNLKDGASREEEPDLAMGLAREKISGVIPLYLFREHWEIARRRAPPIYGFLCTLDIMGFTSGQQYIVPFLVLHRAISNADSSGTTMN
jgi:hypothetical protein